MKTLVLLFPFPHPNSTLLKFHFSPADDIFPRPKPLPCLTWYCTHVNISWTLFTNYWWMSSLSEAGLLVVSCVWRKLRPVAGFLVVELSQEEEERWPNGSAPDCKTVVLGSNPAPPQHTANSVSPEVGSHLGWHSTVCWPLRGGRGTYTQKPIKK